MWSFWDFFHMVAVMDYIRASHLRFCYSNCIVYCHYGIMACGPVCKYKCHLSSGKHVYGIKAIIAAVYAPDVRHVRFPEFVWRIWSWRFSVGVNYLLFCACGLISIPVFWRSCLLPCDLRACLEPLMSVLPCVVFYRLVWMSWCPVLHLATAQVVCLLDLQYSTVDFFDTLQSRRDLWVL